MKLPQPCPRCGEPVMNYSGWCGSCGYKPTPKGHEMADLSKREPGWFRALHPSRWRHRKRGTSYEVLTSTADAQCATGPINEGDHATVYRGDDGDWHVRKTDEFQDGRFERIDLTEGWPTASGENCERAELLAALREVRDYNKGTVNEQQLAMREIAGNALKRAALARAEQTATRGRDEDG